MNSLPECECMLRNAGDIQALYHACHEIQYAYIKKIFISITSEIADTDHECLHRHYIFLLLSP